jgi:integrase
MFAVNRPVPFRSREHPKQAFVFTASRGGPLDYSHWRNRVWRPSVAAVGLTGLTFHDLRRAAATGLFAEGVDLKARAVRS